MPTHAQARSIVQQAFYQVFGRSPTDGEIEAGQALGWQESNYGTGWSAAGAGSHNWGAVQYCANCSCPAGTFPYGDSSPDTGKYSACFRIYPDDVSGAASMLSSAGASALSAPSITEYALRLYQKGYYEGSNANSSQQQDWQDIITNVMDLDPSLSYQRAGRVAGKAVSLDRAATTAANAQGITRALPLLSNASGAVPMVVNPGTSDQTSQTYSIGEIAAFAALAGLAGWAGVKYFQSRRG